MSDLVDDVWRARTPLGRTLRALLMPASLAYGAGIAVRNALYDGGLLESRRVPARVVSVGNLVVGGTGKTPTALWLARALTARGQRVAIVSRGYRKTRPGVVVVGEHGTPLVSPDEGGDEAVLLASRFAGPVITGERRADAAAVACTRFGVDTIVLDDGFQHRALARDADLVLLPPDAGAPRLLPAGPAREPLRALGRARAALVVGDGGAPRLPFGLRWFRGRLVPSALVAPDGSEEPLAVLSGRRVRPVAGIARPERLTSSLERLGAEPSSPLVWADHHRYDAADVARIAAAARDALVVTTEKDLVKLSAFPTLAAVRALRVDLEVDDGDALIALLVPEVALPADRGYRSER